MKKKTWAIVLSVVLVLALAITGTIAYLTDRDSAVNVFTMGNVSIDLTEDFEQGATLTPGVKIEKVPTITNTGKNDAWVWMTVAIPSALETVAGDDKGEGGAANIIHWNCLGSTWEGAINANYYESDLAKGVFADGTTVEDIKAAVENNSTWNIATKVATTTQEINGVTCNVYTMLYNKALAPQETTLPGFYQLYMDATVDIDSNGDLYKVVDGVATKIDWNINENGAPVVYVSAYAVQNEGFADAKAAYDAYTKQWGNNGTEYGDAPILADKREDLSDALQKGDDVFMTDDIEGDADEKTPYGNYTGYVQRGGVFDGQGHTLLIKDLGNNGKQGSWGIETHGGTIKNVTIDGVFRGIVLYSPTEDVIIDNVKLLKSGYAINTAEHSTVEGIDLIVSNSLISGWSSWAGIEAASYTNCEFAEGSYYGSWPYDTLVKPYVDTVFTDCAFAEGYYLDLSELGSDCVITLTNCTVNGQKLTKDICGTKCDGTEMFCVEVPGGRTLADCVIFE